MTFPPSGPAEAGSPLPQPLQLDSVRSHLLLPILLELFFFPIDLCGLSVIIYAASQG